jgi:hypothetical protein
VRLSSSWFAAAIASGRKRSVQARVMGKVG